MDAVAERTHEPVIRYDCRLELKQNQQHHPGNGVQSGGEKLKAQESFTRGLGREPRSSEFLSKEEPDIERQQKKRGVLHHLEHAVTEGDLSHWAWLNVANINEVSVTPVATGARAPRN